MNPHLSSTRDIILSLEDAMKREIIGQHDLVRKLIITLFAGGHALIEGVPGLGKTKTVNTLAQLLGYDFKRISFTPDLLPTDLTGVEIYRPQTGKFEIRKGPIFTNILLADEINRTPPKVQSALLEAMEEGQITIGNETLVLPTPFFVIATENPLEHEGTYPLPEAELDRFFMKIDLTYPHPDDEKKIWNQATEEERDLTDSVKLKPKELIEIQGYIAKNISVDAKIYDYVSDILEMTRGRAMRDPGSDMIRSDASSFRSMRNPAGKEQDISSRRYDRGSDAPLSHISNLESLLSYGASTRAGLALIAGARIVALLEDRDYVNPDDIKYIAHEVLRHRIGLSYEAISLGTTAKEIITDILGKVRIP